jgi:hypothetical protein
MALNRAELHAALLDAFPLPGSFQTLIAGIGKPWGSFAGVNTLLEEAITNVIAKAAAQHWVHDLLKAVAASDAKNNPLIVQFFQKYPELDPAKAPASPADWTRAMTMMANKPFVGRPDLRKYLKVLGAANQSRVLLVDGPDDSGKSYTHDFIEFGATHDPCRIRRIDLDKNSLTLETFVDLLQKELGLPAPPSRDAEQDSRWAERLTTDWILKHTATADPTDEFWLVLDGFAVHEHTPGVHALIEKLCEMVNGTAASQASHFRVVLVNYGSRTPATVEAQAFDEKIVPPTRGDFEPLFIERHLAKGNTENEAKIALDEVFTQAQQQVAQDKEKRPLLFWVNIGTTKAIKKLGL